MRIPVMAYLASQESLIESAIAARSVAPRGLVRGVRTPPGFEPDTSFPAVPVGSGRPRFETLESVAPERSENFVIRGTVEAATPAEVPAEMDGARLFADPQIQPFITCGPAPVGSAADVAQKLDVATLHQAGLDGDGVAVAVLDTGINLPHLVARLGRTPRIDVGNSWTPQDVFGSPFQHQVHHGTMCAYNVLLAAPNATLLDFPILLGSAPGGTVAGRSLSVALLGFSQLLAFWAVAFSPAGGLRYKGLVVNNSWGMYHPSWDFPPGHPGRYSDNRNHPFNIVVSTLARSNADILFAAGNCGSDCPDGRCQNTVTHTIIGANALEDVLTLAGCDINDERVGYSSQGPGIPGMAHEKPDLVAYTHFSGSEAFGQGSADSGTSTACPIAAGIVAALRTSPNAGPAALPSSNLFATLRTTSRQVQGAAGWNSDYGFGIVDAVATAQSLGLMNPGPGT